MRQREAGGKTDPKRRRTKLGGGGKERDERRVDGEEGSREVAGSRREEGGEREVRERKEGEGGKERRRGGEEIRLTLDLSPSTWNVEFNVKMLKC